jgi:hypothetical protein
VLFRFFQFFKELKIKGLLLINREKNQYLKKERKKLQNSMGGESEKKIEKENSLKTPSNDTNIDIHHL